MSQQPFSVMVKPVGSHCNLRCTYCYYLPTPQLGPPRMSDETLETFIRQYIAASPGPVVSFVWHGGEPTLAGLDFYRRAVELQKRHLPKGWTCWNNLQTNGVLLDDEWCEFLVHQRFDVGVSIDGTRWLHDQNRPDPRGIGSYQAAVVAIRRLQTHGLRPDLLCTVTAATAQEPLLVYRSLREFDTGWIQFIPIVRHDANGQLTDDSVSSEDYGEFLCTVFDEWSWYDLGRLNVQLFAETARLVAGGEAGLCWMAPTCGRVLVVEADGGVYSCDHFVNPPHRLGEITSNDIGELVDSPIQVQFGLAKQVDLPFDCLACPWLRYCNGGCPKDRLPNALNHLCAGLKRFFAYAVPRFEEIRSLSKLSHTPTTIMAELRSQALARWQGVGRNDPCPCDSGRKAKQCCWSKRP